ncbi:hypothetical protein, partial [Streptomyces chryseus]
FDVTVTAPDGWTVLGNGVAEHQGAGRWTLAPPPPRSPDHGARAPPPRPGSTYPHHFERGALMRRDARLQTITETLRKPLPHLPAADMICGATVPDIAAARAADGTLAEECRPWAMAAVMLAHHINAALDRLGDGDQASPLARAQGAKRDGDLAGELAALRDADATLNAAPWYPARHGDIVHVAYEQAGHCPAAGETYLVESHAVLEGRQDGDDLFRLRLLAHTHAPGPETDTAAAFTVEAVDCPLYDLWFEAGPQRLTVVRDGRIVHAPAPASGV